MAVTATIKARTGLSPVAKSQSYLIDIQIIIDRGRQPVKTDAPYIGKSVSLSSHFELANQSR